MDVWIAPEICKKHMNMRNKMRMSDKLRIRFDQMVDADMNCNHNITIDAWIVLESRQVLKENKI